MRLGRAFPRMKRRFITTSWRLVPVSNDSNIQPFTNVGLVSASSSSNMLVAELENGVTYYALVVAYNVLG